LTICRRAADWHWMAQANTVDYWDSFKTSATRTTSSSGALAHSSRTVTTFHRPSTMLVCCGNQGMAFIFVLRPTSDRRVR
jgi:hypothetical protein